MAAKSRYDSVTILKGLACFMVFMSHWYDCFYSWGSERIDGLITQFPFYIAYNGNLAVCIFMILSSLLLSLKIINDHGKISWAKIIVKRYVRLTVPITAISAIALFFYKIGWFYNGVTSQLLQNQWLGDFFNLREGALQHFISASFIRTLIEGDSTFYGPMWMMKYMFLGCFFCILLCNILQELNHNGKVIIISLLFGGLFLLDSYYICFLIGIVQAFCAYSDDKLKRKSSMYISLAMGLLCIKLGEIMPYVFIKCGNDSMLSNYPFYNIIAGASFVWGSYLLFDIFNIWQKGKIIHLLKWLGTRSFSVFFTHWLVICSFSCWFYNKTYLYTSGVSIGLNFLLTLFIVITSSCLFYEMIEIKLFHIIFNFITKSFFSDGKSSREQGVY